MGLGTQYDACDIGVLTLRRRSTLIAAFLGILPLHGLHLTLFLERFLPYALRLRWS